jgi:hypothetical protein
MLRQLWIYLMPEDVPALLQAVDAVAPGVCCAPGRCFSGDPELLLSPEGIGSLQFRPVDGGQRFLLFHAQRSRPAALLPTCDGGHCIDERRSDCLIVACSPPRHGALAPAQLFAETHLVQANQRVRKPPTFQRWAAEVFGALSERYPGTAAEFIRVAPGARAFALGGGQLHYLFQRVELGSSPGRTRVSEPHRLLASPA